MNALDTITLRAAYLEERYAAEADLRVAVFSAACSLKNGNVGDATTALRECLEKHDPAGARVLWPTSNSQVTA